METREFIEDVMDFIFWNRERLISGEDTIPTLEGMYKGKVEEKYNEDYNDAVDIAKDYFKVYWNANERMLEGEDFIFFDNAISMADGRYILGISKLEENGVIGYMVSETMEDDWKEEIGLEYVRDILQVIGEFLSE